MGDRTGMTARGGHAMDAKTLAVVLNMFYTGLGIARSLGEHGIPVLGLTSKRGIYGNFTRHARIVFSPDSRTDPKMLAAFLVKVGRELSKRAVIFPTRDDDLVFLDGFRAELEPYYSIVAPASGALNVCLDKWETYLAAKRAQVATPECWVVTGRDEIDRIAAEVWYPCVLKPISAHHWRQGANWRTVGARKAIRISSAAELRHEYDVIARADRRALVQELVPGDDESLIVTACYVNRESRWVAGFNAQKLVQLPAFGTGCIVQTVDRGELFERTARLLGSLGFSGIAEVEYKWDAAAAEFKLIEINPRPWDQHPLGKACGVDLIYTAYCEHAGLPLPTLGRPVPGHKWVAEDAIITGALSLMRRRDERLRQIFQKARGKRIYAIWSAADPAPLVGYLLSRFLPELFVAVIRAGWSILRRRVSAWLRLCERATA